MAGSIGVVRLLFAIQLVTMGAMEMSGPFWPLRLRELVPDGLAFTVAGVGVYVAPMLGIALTGALWGRLGDRYGHRAMMLRALAGLAVTQFGLALATDAGAILALRFVQGAFAGFSAPAQAYGVGMVPSERRGRLFAFLQVSTNVGSLVGAVGGGLILDHANFFWINAAASGLCVGCALAVLALLPPAPQDSRPAQTRQVDATGTTTSLWRNPTILGLLLAHGGLLASRLMPQVPFSIYVRSTFGVENWVVGLCYGLTAAGFIVSAAVWARSFERLPQPRALGRIASVAVSCAAAAAAAGATGSIAVFATAYFAWGVLLGATTPMLIAIISREASERHQGRLLGIVQSTTQASSILGIALGGLIARMAGMSAVYPAVAVLYLVSCLLVLRVRQAVSEKSRRLEGHLT